MTQANDHHRVETVIDIRKPPVSFTGVLCLSVSLTLWQKNQGVGKVVKWRSGHAAWYH